jgi:DNA-binding CsgD family transcriptional regulator
MFSKQIPSLNIDITKRNSILDLKSQLTAREEAVFSMRFMGYSYKYISSKLSLSQHTVKKHCKSARRKHELIFYNDDELLDAIMLSHRYASIQRNVIGVIASNC